MNQDCRTIASLTNESNLLKIFNNILLLCIVFFLHLVTPLNVFAEDSRIDLTPEEREWLQDNPEIKLITPANQPPFSMVDANGNHSGMLADILSILGDAIGQKIFAELVLDNVTDPHERAGELGIYGVASILDFSSNAHKYLLTKPYYSPPISIYTTKENPQRIQNKANLEGKKVVILRNQRFAAGYLDSIGGVKKIIAETPVEQMHLVNSGQADAMIGYFQLPYLTNRKLSPNLEVAFVASSNQKLQIGVNPEYPKLRNILNKAIAEIDSLKINDTHSKWTEVSRKSTPRFELTPQEQAWLEAHPDIKFCFTDSFEPFLIRGINNQHTGIVVDLLKDLNSQLGTNFTMEIDSWPVILEKVKQKELDALLGVAYETADSFGLMKTASYLTVYPTFFARDDAPFSITKLDDIRGKSVAILDQAQVMEKILEPFGSDIKISRYPDNQTVLRMVYEGKTDLAFGISLNSYFINKYIMIGVKPAYTMLAQPTFAGMAVRADWPELQSILNKWITSSEQQFNTIIQEWLGHSVQKISMELTTDEVAWLNKKYEVRVRVGNSPPWEIHVPEPTGMSVDYLKWIGEQFGINFRFISDNKPWIEGFLDIGSRHERFDLYLAAKRTPERLEYLAMSEDYLHSPWVIFTRDDVENVFDIDDIAQKKVAVERGYVMQTKLEKFFPNKDFQIYDSTEEALLAVSSRKADAYVGNLIVTSFHVERLGITNIKVACPTPFGLHSQAMVTRKEWAPLISIINKGLSSMPVLEKQSIANKYSAIRYEHGLSISELIKWSSVAVISAFGVITFILLWNKQLSRKVAERTAELIETESRFGSTFEQAAVGIAHVSLEGEFLRVNRKFSEIVGYTEEELFGLTFQDITHPDDLEADLENVKKVLNGSIETYSMDKRYYHKDGSIVWANLTVSVVFNDEGHSRYFVAVIKDIAARKQAEEKLRQNYDFQEHLTTSVPDAIFSIKMPDRVIEWANDSYNILGYEPEECVGKSTEMFYSSPEGYLEFGSLLQETISAGKDVLLTEAMLRRKSGEVFPAEISISLYKENGNLAGVTTLIRDISVRKQAETKLQESYYEIELLQKQLQAEMCSLQEEIKFEHNFENIIGNSDAIQYVLFKVEQVAETDSTVLILGETGTGKELIARAIHHNSMRSDRPLVKINCATLPPNLIESELFGHEKGSFTGAMARHTGKFQVADKSTLFLDEIGEMPIELQAKLLRVIEDGEFERLGSNKTIKVDVRIIAATNRDLQKDVQEGVFRGDLLYRLNVFPITLPPLRDRLEDIPLLVQHYLSLFTRKLGKNIDIVPKKLMNSLQAYSWPGNVRELQNVIERAVIGTSGNKLQLGEAFQEPLAENQSNGFRPMSDIEREYIIKVLESTNWKVSGKNSAAEILCLDRSTLRARMKRLGIEKPK